MGTFGLIIFGKNVVERLPYFLIGEEKEDPFTVFHPIFDNADHFLTTYHELLSLKFEPLRESDPLKYEVLMLYNNTIKPLTVYDFFIDKVGYDQNENGQYGFYINPNGHFKRFSFGSPAKLPLVETGLGEIYSNNQWIRTLNEYADRTYKKNVKSFSNYVYKEAMASIVDLDNFWWESKHRNDLPWKDPLNIGVKKWLETVNHLWQKIDDNTMITLVTCKL
ncbi:hypothetical protein HGB47_01640 [Leptospira yasudae]|uniref:hypothetical protein n=1 Tax=Leptospira yasudae TaxID=2202201 RepID=UPI001C4ED2F0|nr:hypothetical protein [Leptospira yasudae]MBW0432311.1 hypothetical protein [Leptospira yasudae]